eukprot:gene591-87_t
MAFQEFVLDQIRQFLKFINPGSKVTSDAKDEDKELPSTTIQEYMSRYYAKWNRHPKMNTITNAKGLERIRRTMAKNVWVAQSLKDSGKSSASAGRIHFQKSAIAYWRKVSERRTSIHATIHQQVPFCATSRCSIARVHITNKLDFAFQIWEIWKLKRKI